MFTYYSVNCNRWMIGFSKGMGMFTGAGRGFTINFVRYRVVYKCTWNIGIGMGLGVGVGENRAPQLSQ